MYGYIYQCRWNNMIKIYKIKKDCLKFLRNLYIYIVHQMYINDDYFWWEKLKIPQTVVLCGISSLWHFLFYLIRKFTLLISELVLLHYVVLIFWVICCCCFQHNTVIYEAVHPLTSFSLFPYFIIHSCDHKRKRVRKKAL